MKLPQSNGIDSITIYRNVFSDADCWKIKKYLKSANWSFGHTSEFGSSKKFWNMNLNSEPYFTQDLFVEIQNLIGEEFSIERVYANGQTFGLDGEYHQDCEDDFGYTFLYYPHEEWKLEWGGTTSVFVGSEIKHFYPEPNTAIFFPGKLLHCGHSPTRDYLGLRMSLAYKLRIGLTGG
jgi:hypothetical protein